MTDDRTNTDNGARIDRLAAKLLLSVGGTLTAENMDRLTAEQHSLIAYKFLRDEVMEGGFVQLLHNGYGPYVIDSPFPLFVKREWGLKDFSKLLFEVRREYHLHRAELEADMSDEEFMATYERLERLNDLGDEYLDDFEEEVTAEIARIAAEGALFGAKVSQSPK